MQPTTMRIGRQLTPSRAVDLRRTGVSQIIKKETEHHTLQQVLLKFFKGVY